MKRGILGVKKDPKNQMLLFTNGETWPSDDSNDSDFDPLQYAPPPSPPPPPTKKSRNASQKAGGSGKARSSQKDDDTSTEGHQAKKKSTLKCRKISDPQKGSKSSQVRWEIDSETTAKTVNCGSKSSRDLNVEEEGDETEENDDEGRVSRDRQSPRNWIDIFPYNVVLRIFQFAVRSEGALPFLENVSKVSDLWYDVARHPSLWTKVDFSLYKPAFTAQYLQQLCRERFEKTKELILNGCDSKVTAATITIIGEHCRCLTAIHLSGCRQVNGKLMEVLIKSCPNLASIDLSHISSHASSTSATAFKSIKNVVGRCGPNLTYLNFAGNVMLGVANSFDILGESCPNLQELDMSNVRNNDRSTIVVNIENLQNGCPKLRCLRLANVQLRLESTPLAKQAQSPGFPELEELSIATTNVDYYQGLDDNALERILKSSCKLKLLDVRGCCRITASGLVRIPAFDLEYLFLSQCPGAMTTGIELVMEKWTHSLVEVDLSWNLREIVDATVFSLVTTSKKSNLHTLDLSGSAVSYEPVKAVLTNCPKLASLNLSSCRGLPRGIKRLYKGDDLRKFREDSKVS